MGRILASPLSKSGSAWGLGRHACKLWSAPSVRSVGDTMDQDADWPDERQAGISVNEAGEVVIDLDALLAERDAKVCDANPHDDVNSLDDDVDEAERLAENVLVDDGEDEEDSSQLAMLESSVVLTGGVTVYEIPDDKPAPPEPVEAVETPSLIQRIARLFFGGFR